jgi:hypothetical protein
MKCLLVSVVLVNLICINQKIHHVRSKLLVQFSSFYFRFSRSFMAIKAEDIEHVNIHKSTQIKQNKTIKAVHNIKPC